MNRLSRVLITFASAFALLLFARAQAFTQTPARETNATPEETEDAGAEKAQVRFEGLRFFGEKEVRSTLRYERTGIEGTFDYDPARIEKAVGVLKRLYAGRGFMNASIEVREEPWSKPKLLTFVVDEGERSGIAEIRFAGNRNIQSARLAEAMQECLKRSEDENWRDNYYDELFDLCLRQDVRRAMASEGYLEAKMGETKVEVHKRGLVITVPVEEGVRYRYGRIKVKGLTAFLPSQVLEMMDARPGEVADGLKILKGLSERLTDEYYERGYAQFTYEVDTAFRRPKGPQRDGVVDFKIEVSEGLKFTVSSISFKGNRLKTEDELKSALALREGDVLSRRRFQDGLERLYRMGVFYNIDGVSFPCDYANVDCDFDEDKGQVAISITVDESNL